jgi:hypothetical protein
MDLELATTEDILDELRRRQMRFVFAGVENTNDTRCARVFCAGLGTGRQDLLRLIRQLHFLFQSTDDAALEND